MGQLNGGNNPLRVPWLRTVPSRDRLWESRTVFELPLTYEDRACLRAWGISECADTRTRVEADARLVVPEWLRRCIWRRYWVEQDALAELVESSGGEDQMYIPRRRGGVASRAECIVTPESVVNGGYWTRCTNRATAGTASVGGTLVLLDEEHARHRSVADRFAHTRLALWLCLLIAGLCLLTYVIQ